MFDGIGRRLPFELGCPIDGIRLLGPFPPGNQDPPIVGTLADGRVVSGGVFPIETLMLGWLDSPGNFDVWLFPKLGFSVGFVIVPNPLPLDGLPMLIELEPLPNDGFVGVNFPKLLIFPVVEGLVPVREEVPNLLLPDVEPA